MTAILAIPCVRRRVLPALLPLPLAAVIAAPLLPSPAQMITLAMALYVFSKVATAIHGPALPPGRTAAYLTLWIGMTPAPFARPARAVYAPVRRIVWSLAKIVLGLALLGHVGGHVPPLVAGYTALFALVLLFHFGLFELLYFHWLARGVGVEPLMNHPLRATSLADFWGRRWNLAFHRLAMTFLFRPLARRFAPAVAFIVTFLLSGVVHEVVITVPARGGFGGPTLYFLLQALGIYTQRTVLGRRLHLSGGPLGWLYTATFTIGLAWLLFPPVFIHRVILPLVTF